MSQPCDRIFEAMREAYRSSDLYLISLTVHPVFIEWLDVYTKSGYLWSIPLAPFGLTNQNLLAPGLYTMLSVAVGVDNCPPKKSCSLIAVVIKGILA